MKAFDSDSPIVDPSVTNNRFSINLLWLCALNLILLNWFAVETNTFVVDMVEVASRSASSVKFAEYLRCTAASVQLLGRWPSCAGRRAVCGTLGREASASS